MFYKLKRVFWRVFLKIKQHFYREDRQLLDGVVVVNDNVDLVKRRTYNCLMFKVDLVKVHDLINWSYLLFMFRKMRFSEKMS